MPIRQWGGHKTVGPCLKEPGRRGATDRAVRPRGALLGYAFRTRSRHAPVLIFGLGKVPKSFGRVFQRREGGEEPGEAPGSSTTSRLPRGAAPTPACPTEGHSPSHTRDGTGAPRILELSPLLEGKGGTANASVSSGALAPLARPETVHLRRAAELRTPPGTRRFSYIRAGKSSQIARESFSKKGGGRGARGGPWLLDHLQAPRGAAPPPACPPEGHSPSHTRDGKGPSRILDLFPLLEGKGGRATASVSSGGARPLARARDGAPPSAAGAPRSTPTRWWKLAFTAPENFKGGEGGLPGDPQGTPLGHGTLSRAPGPKCRTPSPT